MESIQQDKKYIYNESYFSKSFMHFKQIVGELVILYGMSTLSDYSYLPNPSARSGYVTRSIFKRSLTGLNSEFPFF